MNPDTSKFEGLFDTADGESEDLSRKKNIERMTEKLKQDHGWLFRGDGSRVPEHWSVFSVDEIVTIKNYTFKVAYIGESTMLLEPAGPVLVGEKE